MNSVLVGSSVIPFHVHSDLVARAPKDTDYFSQTPIEGAETFWHPDLEKWNWGNIATLDELYTIKISHIFWDLKNNTWAKHWWDILWLEDKATFIPELYDILYPIWEERYGKKKVNLNQEPEDFFNGNVKRIYEHDSLHESVAYYDRPLFERILKDDHAVNVDWNKFLGLSDGDKIRLVREEIYATALERFVIPSNYSVGYRSAYSRALKQTITSYWKGKWALFIPLHARELNAPDKNFIEYHHQNNHKLRRII